MSSVRGLEKRSICFSVSVEEWGLWEINDGSVLFSLLLKETMVMMLIVVVVVVRRAIVVYIYRNILS